MGNETIVVKGTAVNSPHVLSAGVFEATLLGTSDSLFTEQKLTILPLGFRSARGKVRVFLQLDNETTSILDSGKGAITLWTKMDGTNGFDIYAAHNLPDGITRDIRVAWFAVGYEDYAPPEENPTLPAEIQARYPRIEVFASGITDTITLTRTPYADSTLVVYADRVGMFYGEDFTVSGKVITISEALLGIEEVIVTYTSAE